MPGRSRPSSPRLSIAIVLGLLTVPLVGCTGLDDATGEDPTGPQEGSMADRAGVLTIPAELGEVRALEATAEDGTPLRGHVYLPAGDGPFATVLLFYPYWNGGGALPATDGLGSEEDGRRTMTDIHALDELMDAGFAIAAVNIRGTGPSGGCFSYMNMPKDGPDANAVVEALASKPWSNGRVGMYGSSYGGAVQDAALAHDPPAALNATVIVSGETDVWNLLGRWGAGMVEPDGSHTTNRDLMQGASLGSTTREPFTYQPTPENLCPDTFEDVAAYEEIKTTGDKNDHYEARSLLDGISESKVPTFVTNGLTDGEAHILQFEGLWDAISHQDKRLLIGQWDHGFPFGDVTSFTVDHVVPWMDHFLRDGPPVETGLVTYQDDTGELHESSAWPAAEAKPARLYLSDRELVTERDQVASSSQRFVTDDASVPVPDACPGDEAVFVSPPLAEDVLVAGNVFVNVTLTSSQPDENIAAYLWTGDELPGCQVGGTTEVTEHRYAMSDLYHRGHLEQGEPFPVGEPGVMEMRTVPMAEVLPAGKRLMLTIGAGHPWLVPTGTETTLSVQTGSGIQGDISLTVVSGPISFETVNSRTGDEPTHLR